MAAVTRRTGMGGAALSTERWCDAESLPARGTLVIATALTRRPLEKLSVPISRARSSSHEASQAADIGSVWDCVLTRSPGSQQSRL